MVAKFPRRDQNSRSNQIRSNQGNFSYGTIKKKTIPRMRNIVCKFIAMGLKNFSICFKIYFLKPLREVERPLVLFCMRGSLTILRQCLAPFQGQSISQVRNFCTVELIYTFSAHKGMGRIISALVFQLYLQYESFKFIQHP